MAWSLAIVGGFVAAWVIVIAAVSSLGRRIARVERRLGVLEERAGVILLVGFVTLGAGVASAQIVPDQKLMIFGGTDHDIYLGCLSCPQWEADSVYNAVGKYGSEISPTSIRNHISLYGSAVATTSACNEIASEPPVLVDKTGKYYGELTQNPVRAKRTTIKAALAWLKLACTEP
jgi:hypothetical protein